LAPVGVAAFQIAAALLAASACGRLLLLGQADRIGPLPSTVAPFLGQLTAIVYEEGEGFALPVANDPALTVGEQLDAAIAPAFGVAVDIGLVPPSIDDAHRGAGGTHRHRTHNRFTE